MKTVWVITDGNVFVRGVYATEPRAQLAMHKLEAEDEAEGKVVLYFISEEEIQ